MATMYAALLRGINVGGNRKIPMAELRALLEETGYDDVRTYLQSGQAVFSCAHATRTASPPSWGRRSSGISASGSTCWCAATPI